MAWYQDPTTEDTQCYESHAHRDLDDPQQRFFSMDSTLTGEDYENMDADSDEDAIPAETLAELVQQMSPIKREETLEWLRAVKQRDGKFVPNPVIGVLNNIPPRSKTYRVDANRTFLKTVDAAIQREVIRKVNKWRRAVQRWRDDNKQTESEGAPKPHVTNDSRNDNKAREHVHHNETATPANDTAQPTHDSSHRPQNTEDAMRRVEDMILKIQLIEWPEHVQRSHLQKAHHYLKQYGHVLREYGRLGNKFEGYISKMALQAIQPMELRQQAKAAMQELRMHHMARDLAKESEPLRFDMTRTLIMEVAREYDDIIQQRRSRQQQHEDTRRDDNSPGKHSVPSSTYTYDTQD